MNSLKYFHKFHKLNLHLYELLALNRFYLAGYKELNDPYDCQIRLTNNCIEELYKSNGPYLPDLERLLEDFRRSRVELSYKDFILNTVTLTVDQAIERIVNNEYIQIEFFNRLQEIIKYYVVGFSKLHHNHKYENLMWAHYCNNFNGVKLSFDFSVERDDFYRKNLLKVRYIPHKSPIDTVDELYNSFFYKTQPWQYEKEYRIVNPIIRYSPFEIKSLMEITFGYNTPHHQVHTILKLCKKIGYQCRYYRQKLTATKIDRELIQP
jgi:hypothetical protein